MKRVGIVICNYNKKSLVLDCIQAILDQSYTDYDLYVVDNASTDGSAEAIKDTYGDRLKLIVNPENLGGTGGFNAGLEAAYDAGYEFLMCVDNDAMLDENAVGELVKFLDEHEEVGMAASKVYHLEDPDYVQNYGQMIDFDRFCTSVYFYNNAEDGSMPPFVYCDAVPACSLMIRSSVAAKIGFLPKHCYLYWDDTEWCHRCRLAGYSVASVGASKALHSMGAKLEYTTTFPTYYAIRNMISFFMRYTPDDRLTNMCREFLSTVYEEQFVGYYTDTLNKADTVMAAYDDAIHGVTGKAPDGRIHDVDKNMDPWRNFFDSADEFVIYDNNNPMLCKKILTIAESLGAAEKVKVASESGENDSAIRIELGSSILTYEARSAALDYLSDASHRYVLIDQNECIVNAGEVEALQDDYEQAKDLFIYSQLPLMKRQAKLLREEML